MSEGDIDLGIHTLDSASELSDKRSSRENTSKHTHTTPHKHTHTHTPVADREKNLLPHCCREKQTKPKDSKIKPRSYSTSLPPPPSLPTTTYTPHSLLKEKVPVIFTCVAAFLDATKYKSTNKKKKNHPIIQI